MPLPEAAVKSLLGKRLMIYCIHCCARGKLEEKGRGSCAWLNIKTLARTKLVIP